MMCSCSAFLKTDFDCIQCPTIIKNDFICFIVPLTVCLSQYKVEREELPIAINVLCAYLFICSFVCLDKREQKNCAGRSLKKILDTIFFPTMGELWHRGNQREIENPFRSFKAEMLRWWHEKKC